MSELYPVSEYFVSPQGEGQWAGTAMFFLRLAGCTVGKLYPKEMYESTSTGTFVSLYQMSKQLPIYTEMCTLYDGREFACDTDYRVKERMTPRAIIEEIPKNVEHVCITGGEPLMHNLSTLFSYLWDAKKKIHIETSGTIYQKLSKDIWVTCSPKKGVLFSMIQRADEFKILVDKDFDVNKCMEVKDAASTLLSMDLIELAHQCPVYLQPVNFENEINSENMKRCMEIQQEYPCFRVCVQLHKAIGVSIGELVR